MLDINDERGWMAKKLINKNAKWDLFIYLFSGTKVILMITYGRAEN
jgi:hypothetical protein